MVIINYWVWFTPNMDIAVQGVTRVGPLDTGEPAPPPIVAASALFPQLNTMRQDTRRMLRNFPQRYGDFPVGLWNCYVRAEGLFALTDMREDMQRIVDAYPELFRVVGCWDYFTGEPVGGVGSPWFRTPAELGDIMPDIPQPGIVTGAPPTTPVPPLVGVIHDIVLGAGQKSRKFV